MAERIWVTLKGRKFNFSFISCQTGAIKWIEELAAETVEFIIPRERILPFKKYLTRESYEISKKIPQATYSKARAVLLEAVSRFCHEDVFQKQVIPYKPLPHGEEIFDQE